MSRVVVVRVGYQDYLVPEAVLPFLPQFQALDRMYVEGIGIVYVRDPKAEIEAHFLDASSILDKAPAPISKPEPPSPAPTGQVEGAEL